VIQQLHNRRFVAVGSGKAEGCPVFRVDCIQQGRTVGKQSRHDLVMSSCSCEVEDCLIISKSCIATLRTESKQQGNDLTCPLLQGAEESQIIAPRCSSPTKDYWQTGKPQCSHVPLVHCSGLVDHLNNLSDEEKKRKELSRCKEEERRQNKRITSLKAGKEGQRDDEYFLLAITKHLSRGSEVKFNVIRSVSGMDCGAILKRVYSETN